MITLKKSNINRTEAPSVKLRSQFGFLLLLIWGCEDTYIAGYNGKFERPIDETIYTEQDSLNLQLKK